MADTLNVSLYPQRLDAGSAEEKAAFGRLEVVANGHRLTEGVFVPEEQYSKGPLVSGYHLAEWLVWNWWRLRFEPKTTARDNTEWEFSHCIASVGEGYVWPNITIESDGLYSDLSSRPTFDTQTTLFRYLGTADKISVASSVLDDALDNFVEQVMRLLGTANLRDTNLHRLWQDLKSERDTPEHARFRRLEALLGFDPDTSDKTILNRHLADTAALGENALEELAACAGHAGNASLMLSADDLATLARQCGFDAHPADAVRLNGAAAEIPAWGEVKAWRIGMATARAVRRQETLDDRPIDNTRLASLAGTTNRTITDSGKVSNGLSFALDDNNGNARVALCSPREERRRFDLARLIGDRLFGGNDRLHPATPASRYRQQAQRTFAAELLSPFDAVDHMLADDTSEEQQQNIAEHFKVSEWTIRTLLVNNGRLAREHAMDLPDRAS